MKLLAVWFFTDEKEEDDGVELGFGEVVGGSGSFPMDPSKVGTFGKFWEVGSVGSAG
jgi:hypothetical protein